VESLKTTKVIDIGTVHAVCRAATASPGLGIAQFGQLRCEAVGNRTTVLVRILVG
jgi:hypothetical protein